MPTHWESSKRPMYVKTVWVDGFRHAILTQDDPYLTKLNIKKKRPHSSVNGGTSHGIDHKHLTVKCKFKKTRPSTTQEQLGECLRNFNFVIESDKTNYKPRMQQKRNEHQEQIEKLDLTELQSESEDELVLKANAQRLNEFETTRSKYNSICIDMKTFRSNRTSRTESVENNGLSERVLQWLDLAGRIDMLAPKNEAIRINQPRHSWPEIQQRNQTHFSKAKTTNELKAARGNTIELRNAGDSARDKVQAESGVIDRYDFYVTAPANTIETYARLSRNAKDTPRHNDAKNAKDTSIKAKIKDPKTIEQTRQKIAYEIQAVEKQYAELINKKIIPKYNKQGSRRQVHIFVPTIPKKQTNSTTTSRSESLISQTNS